MSILHATDEAWVPLLFKEGEQKKVATGAAITIVFYKTPKNSGKLPLNISNRNSL